MLSAYKTINQSYEKMIIEKKSKFIGILVPISDEDQAKEQLEIIRKNHYNASHHCMAYRIGLDQVLERYADDGEPSGTAGMPMLEVLRGVDLKNVMVVAVRYFGGTKLGTGGLVRAYTQVVQDVIGNAAVIIKQLGVLLAITVDYHLSGKLEYLIHQKTYYIQEVQYQVAVTYKVLVAEEAVFINEVTELSGSKAIIENLGHYYSYIEAGKTYLEPKDD